MVYFRETTTMISDLVLSITSFLGGTIRMNQVRHQSWRFSALAWFGMIGFSVVGFAAFLGFLRYGYFFVRRQHSISDYHKYFSDLASIIGMPMIGKVSTTVNLLVMNGYMAYVGVVRPHNQSQRRRQRMTAFAA